MRTPYQNMLIAAATLTLGACGNSGAGNNIPDSLSEVTSIHVQANSCNEGIREALAEHEIGVTSKPDDANATMEVTITSEGRNLDDIPEFGGIGSKAGYNATLRNEEGKVLFSTAGDEGSVAYDELCEDIGDEIASRIEESRV